MVNQTALYKIIKAIKENKFKPMKKWNDRYKFNKLFNRDKYMSKLIFEIREILVLLSGNDVVNMLKGIVFVI